MFGPHRRSARRAAEQAWDAVSVRWPRKTWRFVVRSWRELASQEASLQRRVAKLEANRRAQLNALTTAPQSQLRTEAMDILRLVEPLLNARPDVPAVGGTVGQGKKTTVISQRAQDRPPSPDTEPEEIWHEEDGQENFSLDAEDDIAMTAASKSESDSRGGAANFEAVAAAASKAAELAAKEEALAAEATRREKRDAQERLEKLKEAERIEQAQRAQAAATAAAEARAQAAETKLAAAEARLKQQAKDAAAASAAAASAAAAAATVSTAVAAPAFAAAAVAATSTSVAPAPRAALPFSANALTAAKGTLKVAAGTETSDGGEGPTSGKSSRPGVDPAALMAGARGLKKRLNAGAAEEDSATAASSPSKSQAIRKTSAGAGTGADSAAAPRASTRSGGMISTAQLNDAKSKLGSRQTRGSTSTAAAAAPSKAKSSSLAESESTTTMLKQAMVNQRLRAHPESPASEAGGWSESDTEPVSATPRRATRRSTASSSAAKEASAAAAPAATTTATPKKSASKRASSKAPAATPATAKKRGAGAEPTIPEGNELSDMSTPGGRRVSARVAASGTNETPSKAPTARATRSSARGK